METSASSAKNAAMGAGAGAVASVAMSAFMLAAKQAGFTGKLPPKKITQRALGWMGVKRDAKTTNTATLAAHLGYGSACGAFYNRSVRGRVFPRSPVMEGMLFGSAVWVASYFGWVPALRIMPTPTRDRPGRSWTMLIAHVLFGAVLGKLGSRARPQLG